MRGGVWVASYVVLWVAVLTLTFAVVALLRQIGVLHARLHPLGAHFGGEGPELDSVAPPVVGLDYGRTGRTLLAFTSPSCEVCAVLRPSIEAIGRDYREIQLRTVDLDEGTRATFDAFNVRSTPYFVVVDDTGAVRARGVANSLEQIEELLDDSLREAT